MRFSRLVNPLTISRACGSCTLSLRNTRIAKTNVLSNEPVRKSESAVVARALRSHTRVESFAVSACTRSLGVIRQKLCMQFLFRITRTAVPMTARQQQPQQRKQKKMKKQSGDPIELENFKHHSKAQYSCLCVLDKYEYTHRCVSVNEGSLFLYLSLSLSLSLSRTMWLIEPRPRIIKQTCISSSVVKKLPSVLFRLWDCEWDTTLSSVV